MLDLENARRCLDAGAKFLTSPGVDLEMVDFALKQSAVVFPGALTPTDVMVAWKAGSNFVKVFPCAPLGGPNYIKALKSPFPDVPLDRIRRSQPTYSRRIHPRRSYCNRRWPGFDPPGRHQAACTRMDSRTLKPVPSHGARGSHAKADRITPVYASAHSIGPLQKSELRAIARNQKEVN